MFEIRALTSARRYSVFGLLIKVVGSYAVEQGRFLALLSSGKKMALSRKLKFSDFLKLEFLIQF